MNKVQNCSISYDHGVEFIEQFTSLQHNKACLFNMATGKSTWSEHAMRKATMIDKGMNWPNLTPPSLVPKKPVKLNDKDTRCPPNIFLHLHLNLMAKMSR